MRPAPTPRKQSARQAIVVTRTLMTACGPFELLVVGGRGVGVSTTGGVTGMTGGVVDGVPVQAYPSQHAGACVVPGAS